MSEKRHPPSVRRILDARSKGHVIRSTDVVAVVQLGVLFLYFKWTGVALWLKLASMMQSIVGTVTVGLPTGLNRANTVLIEGVFSTVFSITLLLTISTIVTLGVQVGPVFSPGLLLPQLERINPLVRLKEMLSVQHFFISAKSLLMLVLLIFIMVWLLLRYAPSISVLPFCGSQCVLPVAGGLFMLLWQSVIVFFVIVAAIDWAYQYRRTQQQIKMSHHEVVQEHKETEGNPDIRLHQREAHREAIEGGLLAENVAKSTVVIRNPTHIAVCLLYEPDTTPLPLIVEKGCGNIALQIVRLADVQRQLSWPVSDNYPGRLD